MNSSDVLNCWLHQKKTIYVYIYIYSKACAKNMHGLSLQRDNIMGLVILQQKILKTRRANLWIRYPGILPPWEQLDLWAGSWWRISLVCTRPLLSHILRIDFLRERTWEHLGWGTKGYCTSWQDYFRWFCHFDQLWLSPFTILHSFLEKSGKDAFSRIVLRRVGSVTTMAKAYMMYENT